MGISNPTLHDIGDVDDIHGVTNMSVNRTINNTRTGESHNVTYSLSGTVQYVVEVGNMITPHTLNQTFSKEVELVLNHPNLIQPIVLKRVYTPSH